MTSPIDAAFINAWAADAATVRTILATAEQALATPTTLAAYAPKRLAGAERATARNGVAIITAAGPMFKREGFLTSLLGGSAYGTIRRDLQVAADNPAVKAILLNVDSPGGEAAGVGELAAAVASLRGVKPIIAYAGDLAASAGYWLASAADAIVIGPGAALGSIGVRATYSDTSARDAARGVQSVEFVSSQSPYKKADLSTDDGRNRIQARIDAMAQVFVDTVATNRGVSADHVLSAFGKGDVLIGAAAVAAGMADEIGTFEGTLAKLAAGKPPTRRSPGRKSPTPRVGMPLALVPAPKALAPLPTRPPVPADSLAVAQALAAERERTIAIRDATPSGAEAERDRAIASGESIGSFRETLAVRQVEKALAWLQGHSML